MEALCWPGLARPGGNHWGAPFSPPRASELAHPGAITGGPRSPLRGPLDLPARVRSLGGPVLPSEGLWTCPPRCDHWGAPFSPPRASAPPAGAVS